MANPRFHSPGDVVKDISGQWGIVLSNEQFAAIRSLVKEGLRPGRYFAPGCCRHPDYIIQIPVFFENDTYDVMKAMNLKKPVDVPPEKRTLLEELLSKHTGNGV